jgi:TPR repeat protein
MRRLILIALPVIIAIGVYSAALAGPLEDGRAAHDRGDWQTTLKLLQPLADQGNAEAEDKIGDVYGNGQAVPQDYVEAVKWYRKAADQGNADAQTDLCSMYYKGHGVPQDYAEAVQWCRKAADQGNAQAQFGLGQMYYQGKGVPQNYAEAVQWCRKAADQGNAQAQFLLGSMYEEGLAVQHESGILPPTLTNDHVNAADFHQDALIDGVLSNLPQQAKNRQADLGEAAKWYRKAADQGFADAGFRLGNMYDSGEAMPQDYVEAVKWYRKAAEQGHQGAQQILGWKYERGHGVTQDFVEAYAWYNVGGRPDGSDRVVKYIPSSRLPEAQALAKKYSSLYGKPTRLPDRGTGQ